MRADMAKIIHERPRYQGSGSRRGRAVDFDDMPSHESMRAHHVRQYDHKRPSLNLRPLKRFLESRVGRGWDQVYSELCAELSTASQPESEVREWVSHLVALHVVRAEDGLVREQNKMGIFEIYKDFYVDPKNGNLRKTPRRAKVSWADQKAAERLAFERILGPEKELHKINGIWYWAVYADKPGPIIRSWTYGGETHTSEFAVYVRDAITGTAPKPGVKRYRKSKRQLTTDELKAHGLQNDVVTPPHEKKEYSKWFRT